MPDAARSRGQPRRWMTPERAARRLEIARRFRAGEDSATITRALGTGKSTVFDDLRRVTPELLTERRRERAAESVKRRQRDTAIREGRQRGHTLTRIAAAAGISYQRIQALTRDSQD